MKERMAVGLLAAFALASASEAYAADGRSGGGRAVGRSGGGFSPGARHHGGAPGAGAYAGGRAVPRGYGGPGAVPPSGAQSRHPRAGTGTGGYYYGGGYGHHPYHGYHPYYGRYGYYPYWGYYAYPGYGLPGFGLSFYYNDTYAAPYYSAPYYSAPYYYAAPPAGAYHGSGGGYGSAPAAPAPTDAAVLLLEVVPEDASVWIDDEFRGVGRDVARLALQPGRHRIEAVRPGFRTVTQDVDLEPGGAITVRIELERP
jgi:hypothetical protein